METYLDLMKIIYVAHFLLISVKDSPYMQYFINMAGAEEELYKKWKEITLNSTGSDQVKIYLMLKNYCSKIYKTQSPNCSN